MKNIDDIKSIDDITDVRIFKKKYIVKNSIMNIKTIQNI